MEKETRSTLYVSEVLMIRFRQACNKMFGDRQGKIKQGYELAITEWCDKVLNNKLVPKPPDLLAKKLLEDSVKAETKASVELDQDENMQTNTEESIEAKAKKLAEQRRKEQVDQDEHKVLS